MNNLTYKDFADDELQYLAAAYNAGMRYNAMVSQAQRICECYMKQAITKTLLNNNDVMTQHNLRTIYTFMTDKLNMNIRDIHDDVMVLNNFYTHTRYPGRDAFIASTQDIEAAFKALANIVKRLQEYL